MLKLPLTWKASTMIWFFSSMVSFMVTKGVSSMPPAASSCCSAANMVSGPEKWNLHHSLPTSPPQRIASAS
jgi:hypothetical protein